MPMAGHPTIGSTFALAHERRHRAGRRALRVRPEHRADASRSGMDRRRSELRLDDAAAADVWSDRLRPRAGGGGARPRGDGPRRQPAGAGGLLRGAVSARRAPRSPGRRSRGERYGWIRQAVRGLRPRSADLPVCVRRAFAVRHRLRPHVRARVRHRRGSGDRAAPAVRSAAISSSTASSPVPRPQRIVSQSRRGDGTGRAASTSSIDGTPGAIDRVRVGGDAVLVGRGELLV